MKKSFDVRNREIDNVIRLFTLKLHLAFHGKPHKAIWLFERVDNYTF